MSQDLDSLIKQYDEKGYNTSMLKLVTGKDSKVIEKEIKKFLKLLTKLEKIGEKYKKIRTRAEIFREKTEKIENLLKDPESIKELLAEIKSLVKDKKNYIRDCKKNIKTKWSSFRVDDIKAAIASGNFDDIYEKVNAFENNIHKIDDLKSRLEKLNNREFKKEYEVIAAMLDNPLLIDSIREKIDSLEEKVNNKKSELKREFDAIKSEGYNLDTYENIFSEENLDKIIDTMVQIKEHIKRLNKIGSDLDRYKTEIFADLYEDIKNSLRDVSNIKETEDKFNMLKENISSKMAAIKQVASEWKNENFVIGDLEDIEMLGLDRAYEVMKETEPKIDHMREGRQKLLKIKSNVIMDDVDEAMKISSDPEKTDVLDDKIKEIESKIESIKNNYRMKIKDYASSSYNVEPLEAAMDLSLDNMAEVFVEYESNVKELSGLIRRNEELKTDMFYDDYVRIRMLEKDPTRLDDVRNYVQELEMNIANKLKEYRDLVLEWESEGFNVEDIKEELSGTLDEIKTKIENYSEKINILKALEKELKSIWSRTFENECLEIKELLRSVQNIDKAREEIANLKAKIENKKKEYAKKLEQYRSDGYDVTTIEDILNSHIDVISGKMKEYEAARVKLEGIMKKNEELKCELFRNDYASIKIHDKRPDDLSYAEDKMKELENKIKNLKLELITKFTSWKDDGYDVSELDGLFSSGDLDNTYRKITAFERKIKELKKLEARFAKVDSRVFEDESNQIRKLIKSIDNIDKVKELLPDLEAKDREKRHEFMKKLERYRTVDNLRTDTLEDVMSKNLNDIAEEFFRYGIKVDKLKGMKKDLEHMNIRDNLLAEKKRIYSMTNDPERIEEIREAIENLRSRVS